MKSKLLMAQKGKQEEKEKEERDEEGVLKTCFHIEEIAVKEYVLVRVKTVWLKTLDTIPEMIFFVYTIRFVITLNLFFYLRQFLFYFASSRVASGVASI